MNLDLGLSVQPQTSMGRGFLKALVSFPFPLPSFWLVLMVSTEGGHFGVETMAIKLDESTLSLYQTSELPWQHLSLVHSASGFDLFKISSKMAKKERKKKPPLQGPPAEVFLLTPLS